MAQLQRRADVQGLLRGLRQLPEGHLGHRLHATRRLATEVAYADPRPFGTNFQPTAGDWSTHFYNGKIYESDIRRGLIIWDLDHDLMRRVRTPDLSNPQTQTTSFAQDLEGPAIIVAAPLEGGQFKQGAAADRELQRALTRDSGVESCVGTVADGAAIDTSKIGYHDVHGDGEGQGRQRDDQDGRSTWSTAPKRHGPGGTVPATLALSLGTAPTFRRLHAGRGRDYTASTTANVVSTAGDGRCRSPTRARRTPASWSTARSRWPAAPGVRDQRGGTGAAFARWAARGADVAADLHRAEVQRRRDDERSGRRSANEALRTGTTARR